MLSKTLENILQFREEISRLKKSDKRNLELFGEKKTFKLH